MNFSILCGLDKAHGLEALVSPICSNELADSFMWRSSHWFEGVSWALVLLEWMLPALDCGLLKRRVRVNWSVEQTWRCRHFPWSQDSPGPDTKTVRVHQRVEQILWSV